MTAYLRSIGQFVVIVVLFSAVSALANWPVYRQIPEGSAIVLLTFVHGADRKAECRTRSAEEMAKLAPNMRRALDCPRGRRPIYVELDLANRNIFSASLPPTGIAGDGHSRVYQRFVVPASRAPVWHAPPDGASRHAPAARAGGGSSGTSGPARRGRDGR